MPAARDVQPGKHTLKDRKDDFNETPGIATVAAIIHVLPPPSVIGPVWECACGRGAISKLLLATGYRVISTDLAERGFGFGRIDFLMERKPLASTIVTNPPFKLANAFVRHGLDIGVKHQFILAPLTYLSGDGRSDIIEGPLARVHVFRNRLPMMHRDGWDGKKNTSQMSFAWFEFDADHTGAATIHRITA